MCSPNNYAFFSLHSPDHEWYSPVKKTPGNNSIVILYHCHSSTLRRSVFFFKFILTPSSISYCMTYTYAIYKNCDTRSIHNFELFPLMDTCEFSATITIKFRSVVYTIFIYGILVLHSA